MFCQYEEDPLACYSLYHLCRDPRHLGYVLDFASADYSENNHSETAVGLRLLHTFNIFYLLSLY